jgi:hypothetical protein
MQKELAWLTVWRGWVGCILLALYIFLDLDWLLTLQVEKRLILMVVLPSALIFGPSRTNYKEVVNVDN